MNFIANAVIGQSGGPTAAINATLAGVIRGLKKNEKINTIFGMKNGIEGFLEEKMVNLSELDEEDLSLLSVTPAAALGSCRKKLPQPEDDPTFFKNLLSLFRKYDIRYFFYIGGNDSMDTVDKLSRYAKTTDGQSWPMKFMGVPKTIDNDLACTDHTPGYGSAAKYVATTMQEIACDCAVYTIKAVTLVEVMGRDAGWLTAAAGLPRLSGQPTADLIYLPESVFDYDEFLASVQKCLNKKPNVVVALSEGIRDKDGKYVGEGGQSGAIDIFGHKYLAGAARVLESLIREKIGCKVRAVELSLPQRCAGHCLSGCDIEESLLIGNEAAILAEKAEPGEGNIAVLKRKPEEKYQIAVEAAKVSLVANKVSNVERKWINAEGNNVTDELLYYLLPLIQGEVEIPKKNGLPRHYTFI